MSHFFEGGSINLKPPLVKEKEGAKLIILLVCLVKQAFDANTVVGEILGAATVSPSTNSKADVMRH